MGCYVGFKFVGVYTVLSHPQAIIFYVYRSLSDEMGDFVSQSQAIWQLFYLQWTSLHLGD